jgi:hypothetical protein
MGQHILPGLEVERRTNIPDIRMLLHRLVIKMAGKKSEIKPAKKMDDWLRNK